LKENPKFAAMVSERARKHLTNGGPLTPQKAAQRYSKWAKEIETAVVAESARWGDYRRDAHAYKEGPYQLYTRDDHWRPEIRRLLSDYFPQRTDTVLKQLRAAHLVTGP
jgi:hypothetical protein